MCALLAAVCVSAVPGQTRPARVTIEPRARQSATQPESRNTPNQVRKGGNPRKAILILSDGGDNSSRYTSSEVCKIVREADVQIYAMGIFESMEGGGRTAEELSGPGLLSEVAEQAGGRHFPVKNVNELPDVAAKIGLELRNQYLIGYSQTNTARDGKYRRIKVKVNRPRGAPALRAYWWLGYYGPAQ